MLAEVVELVLIEVPTEVVGAVVAVVVPLLLLLDVDAVVGDVVGLAVELTLVVTADSGLIAELFKLVEVEFSVLPEDEARDTGATVTL